jgi:phospholipase A1
MKKSFIFYSLLACGLCGFSVSSEAQTVQSANPSSTAVGKVRNVLLQDSSTPLFTIEPYLQNYVLPVFYTWKPDQNYFQPQNPNQHQPISNNNVQFQFSIQYGLMQNLFSSNDKLYFAYTQKSNWQAYDKSAYFRDSEYQPELFMTFFRDKSLGDNWFFRTATVGFEHQSNGMGGFYERSWNRAYMDFALTHNKFTLSVKPWIRLHFSGSTDYNPNILRYMGYGRVAMSYQFANNMVTLELRNLLESKFSRGFEELTWNFPIYKRIRGYLKVQSGYGSSVSTYNHYDNSAGFGFIFL